MAWVWIRDELYKSKQHEDATKTNMQGLLKLFRALGLKRALLCAEQNEMSTCTCTTVLRLQGVIIS